jgi:hypothetical protein
MPLSKEQKNQLRKLKNLYWKHCWEDGSQMTRIDDHFLFRYKKSARCVYVDHETLIEFEKSKHMIFMATLF